jgi:hypothetical protein
MDEFSKKYGEAVFAFGMGFMLLNTPEPATWAIWTVGIIISILALISLLQFATQAKFWSEVQATPTRFAPDGDAHDAGTLMFDAASRLVGSYQDSIVFWTSLGSSVVLMGGLLMHELHLVFVLEFLASVIGYAFIKAFLKNYHSYYGILNGTESNV